MLRKELLTRRERNPRYSLRALARDLGMDPSSISRVLSEKEVPSDSFLVSIMTKLNWCSEDKNAFVLAVVKERADRTVSKLTHYKY